MNYTTQVGNPTAHITKKKSRLKIYKGHNVFLNDGDNFELELYNPKQKSVLVKIKLDGFYISQSGIVIKPGQRIFLERFLDTQNKFKFSVYQVANTAENKRAIDLNGDVRIEFYDEQTPSFNPIHLTNGSWNTGWSTINTGTPYMGGNMFVTTSMGTSNIPTSFYSNTTPTGPNIRSKFDTSNTLLSGKPRNLKSKNSIDTGRVEKGEKSNQTFTNSYQNFEYYTTNVIEYKILPISTKNTTVEEIRQYCTECGVKVKKNYKFCPSCGNKI